MHFFCQLYVWHCWRGIIESGLQSIIMLVSRNAGSATSWVCDVIPLTLEERKRQFGKIFPLKFFPVDSVFWTIIFLSESGTTLCYCQTFVVTKCFCCCLCFAFQYVIQTLFSTLVFTIGRPCQNWFPIQLEIVIILELGVAGSPELYSGVHVAFTNSMVQKYKAKQILPVHSTSIVRMLLSGIYRSLYDFF